MKIGELFCELKAGRRVCAWCGVSSAFYRQSLLKDAFEGKLTNVWRTLKGGEIWRIETGTTPPTANLKNYGGDFPFFKASNLAQGRFVRKAITRSSESRFVSRIWWILLPATKPTSISFGSRSKGSPISIICSNPQTTCKK